MWGYYVHVKPVWFSLVNLHYVNLILSHTRDPKDVKLCTVSLSHTHTPIHLNTVLQVPRCLAAQEQGLLEDRDKSHTSRVASIWDMPSL